MSKYRVGQAIGEYIHLKDSSTLPIEKLEISGNSYQETREGYNLFNEKYEIGYFTGNTGTFNTAYNGGHATDYIEIGDNKTLYVLFECFKSCKLGRYWLMEFDENLEGISRRMVPDIYDTSFSFGTTIKTVTLSENCKYIKPSFYSIKINEESFAYDKFSEFFYVCISSKQADKYEPYGAMPSPDFPSAVKSCGDNINLFDKNGTNFNETNLNNFEARKSIANSNLGSTIYINTTSNNRCKAYFNLSANKKVTISFNDNFIMSYLLITDIDGIIAERKFNLATDFTITSDEDRVLCLVFSKKDATEYTDEDIEMLKNSIKIEEGATATEYSKFEQGNMTIVKSNKNLLDFSKFEYKASSCIAQKNSKNELELKSTNAWANILITFTDLQKNTDYCISAKFIETIASDATVGFSIYGNNENNTATMQSIYSQQEKILKNQTVFKKITFNTSDYNYIFVRIWSNATSTIIKQEESLVIVSELQFEKNNEATHFVEHEEEKFIIPVQREMLKGDYIDLKTNEEVHLWEKYIFTGNEEWSSYVNAKTGLTTFRLVFADIKSYNQRQLMSNYFETVVDTEVEDGQIMNRYGNYYNLECVYSEKTLSEFKDWLAEKNAEGKGVYIIYKLIEPTRLPLTAQQTQVLEALQKTKTYRNETIFYSTDEASPIMDITYKQDLATIISNNNKQQNDRITAIENLLSTTETSAMLLDNLEKDLLEEV